MGSIEEVKGEGSRTGSDDGSLSLSRVPSVVELLMFFSSWAPFLRHNQTFRVSQSKSSSLTFAASFIVLANACLCSLPGLFFSFWVRFDERKKLLFYPTAFVRSFVLWQITWWFRKPLNWFSDTRAKFADVMELNKRLGSQFSGRSEFSIINKIIFLTTIHLIKVQ